jgi:predicted Fe-Mo cluster-binding NifX family protein
MKVCIPTDKYLELESPVYGHFGSAPAFVIHDTETGITTAVDNGNQAHAHGHCNPVAALGSAKVDAVVVGGLGARALQALNALGIRVYQAEGDTVRQNVERLKSGALREFAPSGACAGGHGGACSH